MGTLIRNQYSVDNILHIFTLYRDLVKDLLKIEANT